MSDADVQNRINAYWDSRGSSYDGSVGHSLRDTTERAIWLHLLRNQLPPAPAAILDVGTGTGFLAVLLSELGHVVTGVDLSSGMLALAEEKCASLANPPQLQIGDAHNPPGDPGSFDVVISRHVLWTLQDPSQALGNWWRLLRPGGTMIAIDGLWWSGGIDPADTDADAPWNALWKSHYSSDVQDALPLMHAQSIDPMAALVQAVGFVDVTVERLTDLEQLERDRRTSEREPQPRFVLCGCRPHPESATA
ncbi:MAG: methyltransferase domain-containing protein [Blastochloris sp.]|nr:methyltransferase domain-containing protein [Blastochloris sp.]